MAGHEDFKESWPERGLCRLRSNDAVIEGCAAELQEDMAYTLRWSTRVDAATAYSHMVESLGDTAREDLSVHIGPDDTQTEIDFPVDEFDDILPRILGRAANFGLRSEEDSDVSYFWLLGGNFGREIIAYFDGQLPDSVVSLIETTAISPVKDTARACAEHIVAWTTEHSA